MASTTTSTGTTRSLLRKLGILPPSLGAGASTSPNSSASPAPLLTDIELQHKQITAVEAKKLCHALRSNVTITCLKVGCNELRDEGAEAVAVALENHVSLTTLDLGFNSIGDRGAVALGRSLASNCRLRTLYLSGNLIQETGARAMGRALSQNPTLTTLHLTGNSIGPEGANALAEGLVVNRALTKLYLAGNSIGPRGSAQLGAALACNQGLRSLYLSDNQIGDQGAYALAHALQQNRSITVLELGFNHITHVGIGYLLSSLQGYHALKALHLDNNSMGDRGAERVASGLRSMSLELLDVGFNSISTTGVRSLMRALGCNASLHSLTLSGNTLDTEGAKGVATAITSNSTLRELYLDHTSIGHTGERFICMGLESNPFLSLTVLTGFRLGFTLARMGLPSELEALTNEQTLAFLRERRQTAQHLNTPSPYVTNQVECISPMPPPPLPPPLHANVVGTEMEPSSPREHDTEAAGKPVGIHTTSSPSSNIMASGSHTICPPLTPPQAVTGTMAPIPTTGRPGGGGGGVALPPSHLLALSEVAKQPFCAAELCRLHQFYFSPPPNQQIAKSMANHPSTGYHNNHYNQNHPHHEQQQQEPTNVMAAAAVMGNTTPRVDSEEHLPPCKRQCNNLTKTRICYYPRIKTHIEALLKSGISQGEAAVLVLLRQLRYLESLVQSSGIVTSVPDVETTLLDLLV